MLIEARMYPCRDSKKCRHFRNDTYLIFSVLSSSQIALIFDEQYSEHETVETGDVTSPAHWFLRDQSRAIVRTENVTPITNNSVLL